MKVGSLVECIRSLTPDYFDVVHGNVMPVVGETYTVRGIMDHPKGMGIWLEEIVNPICYYTEMQGELVFNAKNFREVQPPMSLEFIEELQFEMV